MKKRLTQTHINALQKVSSALAMSQTMTYRQLILGAENQNRIKKANDYISEAINELNKVQ